MATVRVNEYYDLFDVKKISNTVSTALTNITDNIENTNTTNPFSGFSNWSDFNDNNKTLTTPPATYTPNNQISIVGKHKAPQAINPVHIEDNGDIWCYPPNVSVPYWNKIIFRNFDYNISVAGDFLYKNGVRKNQSIVNFNLVDLTTSNVELLDTGEPPDTVYTFNGDLMWKNNKLTGTIDNYNATPIFLRFDEYPSRSKVIFSRCDKTRNPDIEHRFSYHKSQMEPIKLNISMAASVPTRDIDANFNNTYNQNLTKVEISKLLDSCYFCIEWIYEYEKGN